VSTTRDAKAWATGPRRSTTSQSLLPCHKARIGPDDCDHRSPHPGARRPAPAGDGGPRCAHRRRAVERLRSGAIDPTDCGHGHPGPSGGHRRPGGARAVASDGRNGTPEPISPSAVGCVAVGTPGGKARRGSVAAPTQRGATRPPGVLTATRRDGTPGAAFRRCSSLVGSGPTALLAPGTAPRESRRTHGDGEIGSSSGAPWPSASGAPGVALPRRRVTLGGKARTRSRRRNDHQGEASMKRALQQFILGAGWPRAAAAMAAELSSSRTRTSNGRRFNASGSVSNFGDAGFNDRASSVVIRSGSWQLCSEAYFRGRCVTLGEGSYSTLAVMGLNDRVSSARELSWARRRRRGRWRRHPGARIVLYEGFGFGGSSLPVDGSVANLEGGFNDRAQSLVVHEAPGNCAAMPASADIAPSTARVATGTSAISRTRSARSGRSPPGAAAVAAVVVAAGRWGWRRLGRRGRLGRRQPRRALRRAEPVGAVVRRDQRIHGEPRWNGFNDRASSLRIERGYWMFCSDASFRGNCRTFGPGDYPTLPNGLTTRSRRAGGSTRTILQPEPELGRSRAGAGPRLSGRTRLRRRR